MRRAILVSLAVTSAGLAVTHASQPADPPRVDSAVLKALVAKYRPAPTPFQFGLVGDQQYNPDQEARFPAVIRAMDKEPLAFVVHDGDLKGNQPCTDALFRDRLALFQSSAHPFVFTPGDNDWTDCHQEALGRFDPLERLARLRALFYPSAGQTLGRRTMPVTSQADQASFRSYRENVLWTMGPVVFATVHAVGSNNGLGTSPAGDDEARARIDAGRAWISTAFALAREGGFGAVMLITQANPRFEMPPDDPRRSGFRDIVPLLERETRAFGKPVVLVHGDTHYFRIDKPLPYVDGPRGSSAPPLLRNFTRVETFGPVDLHWLRARVVPTNPNVFLFEPEVWH